MENELFSSMALDALGEMMNISLGSSATAVSNMLDHRVDITTPQVSVIEIKDFVLGNLEPAIGVEIRYIEGLEGRNIMLLRRSDIKVIVDILMGTETADEDFELNELTISAVCEVMNQMMGAAATAMSDFLGFPVNISTPETFELESLEAFRKQYQEGPLVVVRFFLRIEGKMESEFMNIMPVGLAKTLLMGLGLESEINDGSAPAPAPEPEPAPAAEPESSGGSNRTLSQEEIEKMLQGGGAAPAPEPAPEPEPSGGSNRTLSQEEIEKMLSGGAPAPAPTPAAAPAPAPAAPQAQPAASGQPVPPPQAPMPPYPAPGAEGAPYPNGYMGYPPYYPPYPYPYPPQPQERQPDPKVINTKPLPMEPVEASEKLGKEQAQNLELIMEVPLQVTVEIGRARRKVQEILEFTKGSLVVLDKLAGDQVDLFVNGKCIARGEVVVIEDNFGVRITEIVQNPGMEILAQK